MCTASGSYDRHIRRAHGLDKTTDACRLGREGHMHGSGLGQALQHIPGSLMHHGAKGENTGEFPKKGRRKCSHTGHHKN